MSIEVPYTLIVHYPGPHSTFGGFWAWGRDSDSKGIQKCRPLETEEASMRGSIPNLLKPKPKP